MLCVVVATTQPGCTFGGSSIWLQLQRVCWADVRVAARVVNFRLVVAASALKACNLV